MDLSVFETLNGGDVLKQGNDFVLVNSLYNQPHLAMFGGNVEESTTLGTSEKLERFDWWGNQLFFDQQEALQFNSETERVLQNVALNSAGIKQIENAALRDMSYLSEYVEIRVFVSILSNDRIRIDVFMQEPETLDQRNFAFIWDGTRLEQIITNR